MVKRVGVFAPIGKQISDTVTVYSNKKLQFRDTGTYIQSDEDGNLKIASDGSITFAGMIKDAVNILSADADVADEKYSFLELDGSSATVNVTNLTAFKGQRLVIYCSDATNAVTVTTKAGTTLDGTNNKATFGTGDVLELFAVSDTQFVILENVGAVTLASV